MVVRDSTVVGASCMPLIGEDVLDAHRADATRRIASCGGAADARILPRAQLDLLVERLRLLLIPAHNGLVDEVPELQSRLLLPQIVGRDNPIMVGTAPEIASLAQRVLRIREGLIVGVAAMRLSRLVDGITQSCMEDWVLAKAMELPAVRLVERPAMRGSEVGGGQGSIAGAVLQPSLFA